MGFEESLSLDVSPESQGLCVFLEVKREVSGRVPSIQFCNIFFFSMFGCRNGGLLCVKGVEWEVGGDFHDIPGRTSPTHSLHPWNSNSAEGDSFLKEKLSF